MDQIITNATSRKPVVIEEIRIGRIAYGKGSKVPVAVLVDQDGTELGFLSPFRGYCFQVSGSMRGDGDFGSCQVIGLNNALDAVVTEQVHDFGYAMNTTPVGAKAEFLKGAAMIAIHNFTSGRTDLESEFSGCYRVSIFRNGPALRGEETELGDGRKLPHWWGARMLDKFIALAIKYLNPEAYEEYTVPVKQAGQ